MLNFTGSTQKRKVNLGNRFKTDKSKFLEQNRIQRQERERQRDRDRRTAILIARVRQFLDLSIQAESILSSWLEVFDLSLSINPKISADVTMSKIRAFGAWRQWCAQFRFISCFALRNTLGLALKVFNYVSISAKGSGCMLLDDFDLSVLIRSMNKAKTRGISSDAYLEGMLNIFDNKTPTSYPLPITSTITNLSQCLNESNYLEVLPIIFSVNIADSKSHFLLCFSILPSTWLQHMERFAETLCNCLNASLTEVSAMPPSMKISILLNMLTPLSISDPIHVYAFSEMMGTINFHLRTVRDTDMIIDAEANESFQSSLHVNSKIRPYGSCLPRQIEIFEIENFIKTDQITQDQCRDATTEFYVTEEVTNRLQKLHSLSFISRAVEFMRSENSHLLVLCICHLLHVFDESKASICMIIATIPDLAQWMFRQLSGHQIFLAIKDADPQSDICAKSDWAEFCSAKNMVFWNLLYCYEQFLTYWLIVSKENESFADTILKTHDIQDFCCFLKTLCLTLIFEDSDEVHVRRIKDLSLSLLNQLHGKNLRSHFLSDDFWTLKSVDIDVTGLLPAILEDDEQTDSDGSSDDESPSEKSKPQIKHRRLPKLEIFRKVPFFVDFKDRVRVFQALIKENQNSLGTHSLFFSDELNSHHIQLNINRSSLFEDAFEELSLSGPDLRNKWKVTFHNDHGPEAGIDGGGLTKELLTSIVLEASKSQEENGIGLLKETELYELYPSEETYLKYLAGIDLQQQKKKLAYFEFLGMIIGKCLYESVLIDVKFAPFFLAKWKINQSMKSSMNDLFYVDSNLYQNLNKLLDMSDKDLRALDLDFTINELVDGQVHEFDLLPSNGRNLQVTSANRLTYVHLVSDFKLNKSIEVQTRHFLNGLFRIIKPNWLNMFNPVEMQILIGGVNDIDMDDWKRNVSYGGYFDDDITIKLFWEVVAEMSPDERCELVKFVTSVARAPLLGFSTLYPNFGINNSGSPDRLPTASTCHNLLKLPDYRDKRLIREKLLYALHANSGFDLS